MYAVTGRVSLYSDTEETYCTEYMKTAVAGGSGIDQAAAGQCNNPGG